jgi:predicted RNase H-like nuclease (RuvC/YqgF family)
MSEEGESVNENINLSGEEEAPKVPEYTSDTEPTVTEEGGEGTEGTTIEEPLEEQGEDLERSTIEQPSSHVEGQARPTKQKPKVKTVNKIQKSLVDTSNQLVKQRVQIEKINQNLQSLQKQMKGGERQARIINQMRSQIIQIQKQVTQVHKTILKRPVSKLQLGKKVSRSKRKSKK